MLPPKSYNIPINASCEAPCNFSTGPAYLGTGKIAAINKSSGFIILYRFSERDYIEDMGGWYIPPQVACCTLLWGNAVSTYRHEEQKLMEEICCIRRGGKGCISEYEKRNK